MKLPAARLGTRLKVNKKLITYSFWPTKNGLRGNASLQSLLFSLDPWALIDQAIKTSCPAPAREEARACVTQARDFYTAAVDTQRIAARPLTLYYCFMNLVKAFCLTRGSRDSFDQAQHGLAERIRKPLNRELTDAYLCAHVSPNRNGIPQNFAEFHYSLTGEKLTSNREFDVAVLLPQILPGHRLWSFAANKKERFVIVHDIYPLLDKSTGELWLSLYFASDDLSRIGASAKSFLKESSLAPDFSQVFCDEIDAFGRKLICFQQRSPIICSTKKYANHLHRLFDAIRPALWATVATLPPYRRHYVYLRPSNENAQVISQLLAVYALSYYFASITRYRPHHFPRISESSFGPRVHYFITGQPQQFLYLLASEFCKREIAKPSIL
jgi:hypothetical protein